MTGRRFSIAAGVALASLAFVATVAGAKDLKPTSFGAVYSMEVEIDQIPSVKSCAVAGPITIKDQRTETAVGERWHEDTPNLKQTVTMTGDVAAWVREGFGQIARQSMLQTGTAGKPEVVVSVARIWVQETVYRNAEYDGRVVLDVSVNSPAGASCWSGRVEGFAENYGRAGKEINYQETVNHALDRTIATMFGTTGFVDALCTCGAPTQ
jgi:hypothetical protein